MRVTKGNEARHEDFMQQVRGEHSASVAAIAARDADAARRCATEHLRRGQWRIEAAGVIPGRKTGARIGNRNKTRTPPA
jgi:GntR family transcriptional repressor for pyruvate dehydrogenase complex